MPSRAHDPSKRTFYLDNSTLCDAFRAHALGATRPELAAYRPLMQWIEHVAENANLCISVFHLVELAGWGDVATANGVARWYDRMPIVWVKASSTVETEEADYWTLVAAGRSPENPVNPFAGSVLAAFLDMRLDGVVEILGAREPLIKVVEGFRQLGVARDSQRMLEFAQMYRDDRVWAVAQDWSAGQKTEALAWKRRVEVRRLAQAATQRLAANGHAEISQQVQDSLVDLLDAEPRALPSFRIKARFSEGFANSAVRKQQGSKRERDAFSGSMSDFAHLAVGAAYCDVFTCDRTVSTWLGDQRPSFGLRCELAAGSTPGGIDAFVRALTDAPLS